MTISDPPKNPLGAVFIMRRRNLRAIAFKIVGRADIVDDVLQDAYIKLVEGVCAREVLNPFGYCCQVVRNASVDYCRFRAMEASYIAPSSDGDLPDTVGVLDAYTGIDERRLLERIEAILATLPKRSRLAFERYRLHGETQREIAKMLGVSATLVNFIVKDVMRALASCHDEFED